MTTIKTPLPEKQYNVVHDFTGIASSSSLNVEKTLDVIIDYLAELTEVVEGKQTLNLKETLMADIKEAAWEDSWSMSVVNVKDVEAIINRLVP